MKVVFLDIDGVLNTHRVMAMYGSVFIRTIDVKNKLDALGVRFIELLIKNGVKIVLSSTWRLSEDLEFINKQLGFEVIDKTCQYPFKGAVRGDEIKIWLDEHPQVTHYCIIDDDSDMLEEQMPNFVKTKHEDGITFETMNQVCKVLDLELFDLRKYDSKRKDEPAYHSYKDELSYDFK